MRVIIETLAGILAGLFLGALILNDIVSLLLLFFIPDDYHFGVVEWTIAFFFALSLVLFLGNVEENAKGGK